MKKNLPLPITFLVIIICLILFYMIPMVLYGVDILERFFSISISGITCEARGGRWIPKAYSEPSHCYTPSKDQGKKCQQDSDCNSICIFVGTFDADGYPIGACNHKSLPGCYQIIRYKAKDKSGISGTVACSR